MRIHKEGYFIVFVTIFMVLMFNFSVIYFFGGNSVTFLLSFISIILGFLIIQFFRNPVRNIKRNENQILAPVDGKVVIIEEVEESEYFKGKRLQVSIFMSPLNVHVTRYPLGGQVVYSKHHQGKYLVAWHPKSSVLNERTSVVLKNDVWGEVLFRQIAGYIARRIVLYSKVGEKAVQGEDFGFIKFGSRLDIFLPIGSKLNVKIEDKVIGGETIISEI